MRIENECLRKTRRPSFPLHVLGRRTAIVARPQCLGTFFERERSDFGGLQDPVVILNPARKRADMDICRSQAEVVEGAGKQFSSLKSVDMWWQISQPVHFLPERVCHFGEFPGSSTYGDESARCA